MGRAARPCGLDAGQRRRRDGAPVRRSLPLPWWEVAMRAIPAAVIVTAYPRKRDIDHDALFHLLGWDDLIKNPDYANTCAVRVSLALIRSGVHIPDGRIPI